VPLQCDRRTGLWIGLPSRVTGHYKEDRLVLVVNAKWTLGATPQIKQAEYPMKSRGCKGQKTRGRTLNMKRKPANH
jgi:hypothetical protein